MTGNFRYLRAFFTHGMMHSTNLSTAAMLAEPDSTPADLLAWLADPDRGGYIAARMLPDGSIACLGRLAFTDALYLGVTRWGWACRFCFSDRALAAQRFHELRTEDDTPEGYIARRPEAAR